MMSVLPLRFGDDSGLQSSLSGSRCFHRLVNESAHGVAYSVTMTVSTVAPNVAFSVWSSHGSSLEGAEIDLVTLGAEPRFNDESSDAWTITKNAYSSCSESDAGFTPDHTGMYIVGLAVSDGDGRADGFDPATITFTGIASGIQIAEVPESASDVTRIDNGTAVTDSSSDDTDTGIVWVVSKSRNQRGAGAGNSFPFICDDIADSDTIATATEMNRLAGFDVDDVAVDDADSIVWFAGRK